MISIPYPGRTAIFPVDNLFYQQAANDHCYSPCDDYDKPLKQRTPTELLQHVSRLKERGVLSHKEASALTDVINIERWLQFAESHTGCAIPNELQSERTFCLHRYLSDSNNEYEIVRKLSRYA